MRRLMLAASLAALTACATDPNAATLSRAKARWLDRGPQSYEITIQRLCFCPTIEPVRVRVERGVILSRTVVATGQPLDPALAEFYPDVPGLFALVEDAYRRAAQVNVTFNADQGYPESTVIDYVKNAIDDELTVRVTALTPYYPPQ